MRTENGMIIFDNLLEGDREFGAADSTVQTIEPAEKAKQPNAIGTFTDRSLEETHERARLFGAMLKRCATENT